MSSSGRVMDCRLGHGAPKLLSVIWALAFFALLLTAGAALMIAAPQENAKSVDRLFFIGLAVVVDAGLIWAVVVYWLKKRLQRASPAVLRIDEQGIQFGRDLKESMPWSSVKAVDGRVRREKRNLVEAVLLVTLADGKSPALDIKPLDRKPEQIIDFAKAMLRDVRGIKVSELKDFAAQVRCPVCGEMSSNMKWIQSGVIVFLLFYNSYSLERIACCQRCARRILGRHSAINLLTCHITWPLLWLVAVLLPQSGKLLLPGHDKKALENVA